MTQPDDPSRPARIHPDRIDGVAASKDPGSPKDPATPDAVAKVLEKAFITGGLRRIPKHPDHRDIVLVVLCATLRRRHPYSEVEINACLRTSLEEMKATVDHVTCRRYLVDLGFLKRDRAGTRYLLNYPRLEATLSAEAASSIAGLVKDALAGSRRPPPRHDS